MSVPTSLNDVLLCDVCSGALCACVQSACMWCACMPCYQRQVTVKSAKQNRMVPNQLAGVLQRAPLR